MLDTLNLSHSLLFNVLQLDEASQTQAQNRSQSTAVNNYAPI